LLFVRIVLQDVIKYKSKTSIALIAFFFD